MYHLSNSVNGVGCHGAMPETGVDSINIAAHIYLSMQEILSRVVGEQSVITFEGGSMGSEDFASYGDNVVENK